MSKYIKLVNNTSTNILVMFHDELIKIAKTGEIPLEFSDMFKFSRVINNDMIILVIDDIDLK